MRYKRVRSSRKEPMKRREFILFAGGAALASTATVRAQQVGPMPVVGLPA
jgi:hypothetical protein